MRAPIRSQSPNRLRLINIGSALCAAALISCGMPAHSQGDSGGRVPSIGADAGIYLPTSSKTRDLYGSQWTSFGIGLGSIGTPTEQGHTGTDLQVLYSKRGDNSALLIPIGVEYRRSLGTPNTSFTPYWALGLDIVPNAIKSIPDNVDYKWRAAAGATAAVGADFGKSAFIEARYRAVSHVEGIDLSGTAFTIGVRF